MMLLMHAHFIRRCLELAENGRGKVSPNPLVGCVIVAGGSVVTEGFHGEFGGPHAEVSALRKAGELAQGATLYVNLEPCCMEGKQPPCTDAIIRAGIAMVVFGARDASNAGAGVLRKSGIVVVGPVLEPECRRLNRGFFSIVENGRPWVTLKKALTRDGIIAKEHVTSEEQDRWSHARLRATHDAIVVGAGTVIADNPKLTVRFPDSNPSLRPNPHRIILDPHNEVPPDAAVLTDADASRTLVIREKLPIPTLLQQLRDEGITSLLIEGGPKVWQSFEESGCIDEEVILVG